MQFKNKSILILSPNKWGKMQISKHHYALELAKKGNTVYFFNPPDLKNKYFNIKEVKNNLFVINYKPIFRAERFLPKFLFNFLIKLQIKFIQRKINISIDILWSFSSSIFYNLNWFKSKYKIFFPVDQIETKKEQNIAKNADIIFSVSEVILKKIVDFKNKCFFINHGLSDIYTKNISISKILPYKKKSSIKIGFIGNLLIKSLDRKIFKTIIQENPKIDFILYGAYEICGNNLSGYQSKETDEFIDFLKNKKNVKLKGSYEPIEIIKEIYDFDAFLLLINPQNDYNNGSNSHKILEYLSTGKVIVSNFVSTYADKKKLIEMVDEMHNEKFPSLFKKVINNLEYYNSPELQKKRIEYALDNTYKKQIQRIENLISKQIHL